jgi:CBS domain-containing protein
VPAARRGQSTNFHWYFERDRRSAGAYSPAAGNFLEPAGFAEDARLGTYGGKAIAHRDQWRVAMRVYEVMSKAVETVKPTVHASEAKTRMRQNKINHLVVTKGAELAGIVSQRDLGGGKLPKTLGTWTVEDLMTSPVVTVTSRTPIRRAAALMKGRSIGSLVVTSASGKVAGIVTVSDLLDYLARKPEHKSNRDMRRAKQFTEAVWE